MVAHKVKPFPWIAEGSPLFALSQSCAFIMAANWVMQGVRGMDRGECLFRLGLLALMAGSLMASGLSPAAAFITAHTINFAANGHPWVCLRYCAIYRRSPQAIEGWLNLWCQRLRRFAWLSEVVVIGSRAKRLASARSDIDLRLIMAPGLVGWLLTNGLMLWMRTEALFRAIPLDLYAYDHPQSLKRFDQEEPLGIVKDRHNRLSLLFAQRRIEWL